MQVRISQQDRLKLAKFLKDARKNAGITQREISDACGWSSPQYISNIERGISSPPIRSLKIMVKMYKLNKEKVAGLMMASLNNAIRKELKIT